MKNIVEPDLKFGNKNPNDKEVEILITEDPEKQEIIIDVLSEDEPTDAILSEIEVSDVETESVSSDEIIAGVTSPVKNQKKQGGTGRKLMKGDNDKRDIHNPVKIFLTELGRISLLSREEEVELAKKIEAAKAKLEAIKAKIETEANMDTAKAAKIKSAQQKVKLALNEMTKANLRLVVGIAKKYTNRGLHFPDLIQEGNVGLMKAVDKFEYQRGFKFSTYATWWIRQAITRAISDQARTIRVPVHMVEKINRFIRTENFLRQKLERCPDDAEMANEMELPVEKIRKFRAIISRSRTESLSNPVDSHSANSEAGNSLGDLLEDTSSPSPEEETALAENQKFWHIVSQALRCDGNNRMLYIMSERNKKRPLTDILTELKIDKLSHAERRFYIWTRRNQCTLEEIGKELGVTREMVRQAEAKALKRLQHPKWKNKLKQFL